MPAYKDEKRGTWYVKFRYTDWTGRRVETMKRGFARKTDAKEYEENAKKNKTSNGLTLGELCAIYMEDMRHRVRATSIKTKLIIYNTHVLPYFESTPLDMITPAVVRKWQTEIIKQNLSPTYVKTIQRQFSALVNYAVKYYNLPQNPVKLAGSIGKNDAEKMDFWTVDEFRKFIRYEDSPLYRAAFLVLFWCGLRIGELLALTGNDVDAESHTIRIDKAFTRLRKGDDVISAPKTAGSVRTLTAPSSVIDAILEHEQKLFGYKPTDRLFPVVGQSIRRHMKELCRKAGVKQIRVHGLRHSHASYLINNNVPIKLISQRLGHDNIETTLKVYAHMYKDTAESVTDMMEKDSKKMWSRCGHRQNKKARNG